MDYLEHQRCDKRSDSPSKLIDDFGNLLKTEIGNSSKHGNDQAAKQEVSIKILTALQSRLTS